MSFGEAIKYCLRNMFVFSGRARRSEFWWYYLFITIISMVGFGVFMILFMIGSFGPLFALTDDYGNVNDGAVVAWFAGMAIAYLLLFVFNAALTVAMLGASARRLHDTGQSGHWLWLYLAGLGIVPLIMCIMEGQPYANQWGPDPKAEERARMAQFYTGQANVAVPPPPAPLATPPAGATAADPFATPPSA